MQSARQLPPLTAAIISPDLGRREKLVRILESLPGIEAVWTLPDYPDSQNVMRLAEAERCVLFLDFAKVESAIAVASLVDQNLKSVAVIAFNIPESDPNLLISLMRVGVREVLAREWVADDIAARLEQLSHRIPDHPDRTEDATTDPSLGDVYAFSPARPGSGTTMIAANVAVAAAENVNAALIDFDLRLGMTTFLLRLSGVHSVREALAKSHELNWDYWQMLVSQYGKLDILGSAPSEAFDDPTPEQFLQVLEFARSHYDAVFLDLPGSMRKEEIEILRRAAKIFLVSTPDIGSLHVARRKVELFESLHLADRVVLIMNRVGSRSLPARDIQKVIGLPVSFSLPFDEKAVIQAVESGKPISRGSALARQLAAIAQLAAAKAPAQRELPRVRKFVDYFSISKARLGSVWE